MSDEKRSFSVVYENKKHFFKGTTPLSVSKKVITKLCKLYKKKEVKFELNETTKDSKKKKYGPYIGHIEDLKAKVCLVGGKGKGRPRGTPIHNLNLHHMEKKAKLRIKRSKSNESKLQDLYKSLYLGHHTHTNIYKEAVKGRIRMLEFKIKQKEQKQKEQEQEQLDQYINQPAFTEHGYRSSNKKPRQNDSRLKYSHNNNKYQPNNENNKNNENNENNGNNNENDEKNNRKEKLMSQKKTLEAQIKELEKQRNEELLKNKNNSHKLSDIRFNLENTISELFITKCNIELIKSDKEIKIKRKEIKKIKKYIGKNETKKEEVKKIMDQLDNILFDLENEKILKII